MNIDRMRFFSWYRTNPVILLLALAIAGYQARLANPAADAADAVNHRTQVVDQHKQAEQNRKKAEQNRVDLQAYRAAGAARTRRVDAGRVERLRDPDTGQPMVRWRTKISAESRPDLTCFYRLDDKGMPDSQIHISLEYRATRGTPFDNDRQTAVEAGEGKAIDYPSKRDRVFRDRMAWDRVTFEAGHLVLEAWGLPRGTGLRFGNTVVYATDEQREVLAQFLAEHAKDAKAAGLTIEMLDQSLLP